MLHTRFKRTESLTDLDAAVHAWQAALVAAAADDPEAAKTSFSLGFALQQRFQHTGSLACGASRRSLPSTSRRPAPPVGAGQPLPDPVAGPELRGTEAARDRFSEAQVTLAAVRCDRHRVLAVAIPPTPWAEEPTLQTSILFPDVQPGSARMSCSQKSDGWPTEPSGEQAS